MDSDHLANDTHYLPNSIIPRLDGALFAMIWQGLGPRKGDMYVVELPHAVHGWGYATVVGTFHDRESANAAMLDWGRAQR